jgi:hypothetical protein
MMTQQPVAGVQGARALARIWLPAALVFVVGLALYSRTLLPDVGAWDTAEFQAIGPVLGIAHPTGYPTYTLVAWLGSVLLQPFGNEAYRADLLSALLVAGAGALATIATVRLTGRPLLGVLAGLAFIVTPIAWRVAVRADAHALHIFLAATILVLLIEWQRRQQAGPWLVAAAVVFGLSLGNHALTLLLAPGVAIFVLAVAPRILWQRWRLVLVCLAAVAVTTVLVYAYIPIRSSMGPPLDYAEPRTWEQFRYLVFGEQFQGSIRPLPPFADIVAQIWDQLVVNLGALVILVPAGLILGTLRHWRFVALSALWFGSTWFFALGYANAIIERYYLLPLLLACMWVALAVDVAWDASRALLLQRRSAARDEKAGRSLRLAAGGLAGVVLAAAILAPLPERYGKVDASGDTSGRDWLEGTFSALEPDAAIVSWWSYSTTLWYGRWVEGRRDDIIIIDDRDVLDDGYGTAAGAIDHFLPDRPVYIVRLDHELAALNERYELEAVKTDPPVGNLYRVVGRRADTAAAPA